MTSDKDAAANALADVRGTIERTAFRLAALPEDRRAQQLAIVRNAHEEARRGTVADALVLPLRGPDHPPRWQHVQRLETRRAKPGNRMNGKRGWRRY
jgi:hypothetical protein